MVSDAKGTCTKCGGQETVKIYRSINVASQPELKEEVKSGALFTWTCPHCGTVNLMRYDTLYHDPDQKLMILLADAGTPLNGTIQDMFSRDEALQAYTARFVSEPGELIEKVKIFDAGLDDMVIELCKYVTVMEMDKDIKGMKFFRMEGADNEITLTYPHNGDMEMISIGFNVYEDCRGILQRNPAIKEKATGLVKIDAQWVSQFFR